jgi:serine/threonine protein kinase
MDIAASPEYDLLERINEHGPFSAYRARNTKSGAICFLKSVRFDRPDTVEGFRQHVLNALRLQNSLRNSHVIKATRVTPSADSVLVEYPWLDRADWIPASEMTSLANLTAVLVKVCFVLDYLHQFDFVHGDAKLHNFMVSRRSGRLHVRAGDLELLCRNGSTPHSVIFGSPEHIAPEILANDRIVFQSDQYSIGVSLGKLLDSLSEQEREAGGQAAANLLALKDQLCQPDYHQRPRHLLDACHKNNLISSEEYAGYLHRLLRSGNMAVRRRARSTLLTDSWSRAFVCTDSLLKQSVTILLLRLPIRLSPCAPL